MHEPRNEQCPQCETGYPVRCHCGGLVHGESEQCMCDLCGRVGMTTTIILQLKPPYDADHDNALNLLAQAALALFGVGGRLDANQVETHLGYCNTPVQGPGYVRVIIDEQYAEALITMGENEVARVILEEPTWQEDILDEFGQPTGQTRTCYLGVIG